MERRGPFCDEHSDVRASQESAALHFPATRRTTLSYVENVGTWANDCDALQLLLDFADNKSLRAIVGIWGNATHPNALRQLQACAQLRLATGVGLFHPKFYLFVNRLAELGG